jgi:hypothetical protein
MYNIFGNLMHFIIFCKRIRDILNIKTTTIIPKSIPVRQYHIITQATTAKPNKDSFRRLVLPCSQLCQAYNTKKRES